MITIAEDFPFLCRIREVLDTFWKSYDVKNGPIGAGMCGITSVFLLKIIEDRGETGWELACGINELYHGEEISQQNLGFFDGRHWHSHIWLQKDDKILDLAASQFGASEIISGKIDSRYRGHIISGGLKNPIAVSMNSAADLWFRDWKEIETASKFPSIRHKDYEKLEL
jgi:hypothetical protein